MLTFDKQVEITVIGPSLSCRFPGSSFLPVYLYIFQPSALYSVSLTISSPLRVFAHLPHLACPPGSEAFPTMAGIRCGQMAGRLEDGCGTR